MVIKLRYGVAYNSRGRYKTGNKDKAMYQAWQNMIERCYSSSEDIRVKHPTYNECTVASEWHDYQVFADWYENDKYSKSGYRLDKDILVKNNKIYSPKNCCLVPSEINNLLLDSEAARSNNPKGVSFNKPMGKYFASIKIRGVKTHLGYFECPNEAYAAYKLAKECYVKDRALEWRDRIANEVFEALMKWSLDS